jgi:hypothetical protein
MGEGIVPFGSGDRSSIFFKMSGASVEECVAVEVAMHDEECYLASKSCST